MNYHLYYLSYDKKGSRKKCWKQTKVDRKKNENKKDHKHTKIVLQGMEIHQIY